MRLNSYSDGAALANDLIASGPPVRPHRDLLATSGQLRAFLIEHGLPGDAEVDDREVDRARELRAELYRALGEHDPAGTVNRLNRLLTRHGAKPSLVAEDGGWRWELSAPAGAGPMACAAVEAAAGVLAVIGELGPHRLRSCANPTCRGRFVDTSRPGTRRYDLPAICGNRLNVAAHRARRRADQPDGR